MVSSGWEVKKTIAEWNANVLNLEWLCPERFKQSQKQGKAIIYETEKAF